MASQEIQRFVDAQKTMRTITDYEACEEEIRILSVCYAHSE